MFWKFVMVMVTCSALTTFTSITEMTDRGCPGDPRIFDKTPSVVCSATALQHLRATHATSTAVMGFGKRLTKGVDPSPNAEGSVFPKNKG